MLILHLPFKLLVCAKCKQLKIIIIKEKIVIRAYVRFQLPQSFIALKSALTLHHPHNYLLLYCN